MQQRVGAYEYLLEPMNARTQLAVVRRIMPVVANSGPLLRQLIGSFSGETADVFGAIGPLAEAIGGLTDEATNFVIDAALAVCRRSTGPNTWAPLMQGHAVMFADLTLAQQLYLTTIVLKENLGGFLGELQSMFQLGSPSQVHNLSQPPTGSGFSTG